MDDNSSLGNEDVNGVVGVRNALNQQEDRIAVVLPRGYLLVLVLLLLSLSLYILEIELVWFECFWGWGFNYEGTRGV